MEMPWEVPGMVWVSAEEARILSPLCCYYLDGVSDSEH